MTLAATQDLDDAPLDPPGRTPRLSVVERTTQILDTFADSPDAILLEDITRITGLPRSTAFRILRQLMKQGWIEYDDPGYRLGPRLEALATRTVDYESIRAAASVPLNDLQLASGAVVHLSVLEGGVVHYLDKVGGAASHLVPSRVGARILASDTVSGRSMMAHLSPERVEDILRTATRTEVLDPDATSRLHQELHQIRQRHGIAISNGEGRRSQITSVGAAVLGPRGPIASVSVAVKGPTSAGQLAPMVLRATRQIAATLHPTAATSPGIRRQG